MKAQRAYVLTLLFCIVSSLFCFAQVQPVGSIVGNQTVIQVPISASGTQSQALIYYPDDYFLPANANKKYPLFLFLHGAGEGSGSNINIVNNTSLPQLIKQGLKPYGIDSLTGDTLKFIVVSPHAANTNFSYSYPQVRYILPHLLSTYRIDTTCVWAGGLSAGARGTWSLVMEDTAFGKKLTGIVTLANGGYDNEFNNAAKRRILDTVVKRGLAVFTNVGTQDPGYNGSLTYKAEVELYAQPKRSFYNAVLNGLHNSGVWNPPFQMNNRIFNPTKNLWDMMVNIRKKSTQFEVNAGPDITIQLPVTTATVSSNTVLPSGVSISSRFWQQVSGPNTANITSPANATTAITNLIQGTYVFRITVTTSDGNSANDDVSVTVNAASNAAPVANAGADQTITLPTNTVTVNGSGTDSDGTISSFLWAKITGGTANILTPASATTVINNLASGTYTFRLTVTDNNGATATDEVIITVNNAPTPPPPPPPPPPPSTGLRVRKVGATEYRVAYLFTDSTVRSLYFNNASGKVELMPYNLNGQKAIDLTMGFNVSCILDNAGGGKGYPWVSRTNSIIVDRISTDTLGNPFNNVIDVEGYFFTYAAIRDDSSVWYWGGDDYRLFPGTNPINKPIRLSPPGMKFKKIVMGASILGLTTTGEVYQWNKDGSTTPTKRTLPVNRPAVDIFASHYSYFGCIIPDATGSQEMGYPYVWGSEFGFWGGTTGYAEPTSVKALWNVTVPIKHIIANQNTIHYIDSLNRMFGIGDNAQGEVGNGEELVNHAEIYPTPYNWSWAKGEFFTGAPAQHISPSTQFKEIFTSNTFTFYLYALDVNDSLYFWGRDKSFLGGSGVANSQAATYPNALDKLVPTMVSPAGILPTTSAYYTFTPYTINGGPDQVINASTTTLSGTATASTLVAPNRPNPGYTIAGYEWSKISGPSCTIVSPNSATTTVNGLQTGTYKFKFKMTDNNTATITDTVTVYVNSLPPNQAPTANAGPDQTITLPVSSVTLNGSGTDTDGSITTYQWTKISGPAAFVIGSPSQAQTLISGLVQGVYVFQLQVTDNSGATATDQVQITVNAAVPPPNQTPSANAGADQIITLPVNSITLNGSGTDPDGTISSYQWTKISGPVTFTIVSPSQAQTLVSGLVQGIYVFQLQVTDNNGATSTDQVQVTVNAAIPPPNQAPTANAGTDQTITLPVNSVTLTGSGADTDGTIASYQWTKVAGPATFTIASPSQAQTVISGLVQGVYTFQLQVTDDDGATAVDQVLVTVNAAIPPPNQAPTANAGADQTITLPVNTVTFTGTGTDQDGTITAYLWTKVSGPSAFTIASPSQAQTVISGLVQGVYTFQLEVTDNDGATAVDLVMVTVNAAIPPPNQAPTANAGTDQTITLPVSSVTLNGSGTDPDGTIAAYQWTKVAGPAAFVIASPSQAQTVISGLVQGVYTFQLQVTDNNGATAVDQVQITVFAAAPPQNQAPTANAGSDMTITLPVNSVTLNGSGTDTDGTIIAYQWTKVAGPASFIIASPSQAQTLISGLEQGTYTFQFQVTDNNGATGIDQVQITVNAAIPPPNQAPTANAGPDQSITLPINAVTLTGSGTDPDGNITSYQWIKVSGPAFFTISAPSQAQTLVTGLAEGHYVFRLQVTDDQGATATDEVEIIVYPAVSKLKIFPNPVIDKMWIDIVASTMVSETNIYVYDAKGAVVYSESFMRTQQTRLQAIDLSNLPKGTYFIRVDVDINNTVTQKFIKL